MEEEIISDRQRLVREVGKKLEANVWKILNDLLNRKEIYAYNVKDIRRWAKKEPNSQKLLEYIKVPVKNSCTQEQIMTLPDTDTLVVYRQEDKVKNTVNYYPLCIVSCKASFHARETESLFWSVLMRQSKVKYVLVTEDANRYNPDPKKRNSELKTCENGNKIRRLLECFLDRTYIIKKYDQVKNGLVNDINSFYAIFEKAEAQNYRNVNSRVFDDYNRQPHATYCGNVRPFDDLLFDIMKWKFEKLG
jgi:hypothetical protein